MKYNTHNGQWGQGMVRSMYPSSMGGPFGYPSKPLPNFTDFASQSIPKLRNGIGYTGSGVVAKKSMFGYQPRLRLTPGGMTTSDNWGWFKFGNCGCADCMNKSKSPKRRRSKKRSKRRKK